MMVKKLTINSNDSMMIDDCDIQEKGHVKTGL